MPDADMGRSNAVDSTSNLLEGYKVVSLPNLSTLRHPPEERETYTFEVREQATQTHLVVALARCLGAYCGVSDVLIGRQSVEEDASVAGKRLVAARVCWEDELTWESLLQRIKIVDVGGDSAGLSRSLGLEEDAGQSPFLAVISPEANYDHPLVAWLNSEMSTVNLQYSTLFFHSSAAEILANHIDVVIRHILEHPESRPKSVSFLPRSLLSAVEERKESTYTHFPVARTVSEYVARTAKSCPDWIALLFYSDLYREDALEHVQKLTFNDLHCRSNQFAAYLCDLGLKQEDRVALCMPRGIEFHVCMLGLLKAGACYVPIDPELPDERRNFIAHDSAARFVFTADNIQEHIQKALSYPEEDIDVARPEGLAYMLYTSGTTGTPKGCLLTHEGFAHAIHTLSWFSNQAGPNKGRWPQEGRYLAVASVAFDVHLAETFVPFALGMALVSGPRAQFLEDLPRWIEEMRVTHIGIVPSLIEATMLAVAESVETAEDDGNAEKSMALSYIASGGEKMSDSILERWADHPQVTLANFYGPSEVTIGCSGRMMSSNTRKENVGRIWDNCSAYVVDENLDILMRGGVGELLVGGRLVGRGYHNRPDLTEKAFINWEGGKAYRTGDLARLMPDDTIEIMGRIDTQIKLRGVRIESEGISAVIRNAAKSFPGLATKTAPDVSTVLTRHPTLQTDQLVSFIAWDPTVTIAVRRTAKPKVLAHTPRGLMKALRDACARELASYMRPAHIVPLDFLPLNTNGKTDNKVLISIFQAESLEALSKAGSVRQDVGGEVLHTRQLTDTESKIADAVAKYTVVPRDRLSPTSNLFELGFDSLKLVRLASTLRSSFSATSSTITIADLIQNPTIEELDALLTAKQASTTNSDKKSFSATFEQTWRPRLEETMDLGTVESVLPTFPVQDGVLYRSADLDTLYIQHVILKLDEDILVERLKNVWERLMRHYPILRTVFFFSTSIAQVVMKPEAVGLPWAEHDRDIDGPDSFTTQFFEQDAGDIAKDINHNISIKPPFRLNLYRSKPSACYLSVAIHHSIYDGMSLEYLLRDVESLYKDIELSPSVSPGQVLDEINNFNQEDALRFWKEVFNGFDWATIPGRIASGEVAHTTSLVFHDSLKFWEEMAAKSKVSIQALLTASFGTCLGRHLYNHSDVVFGVIRSGRSFADERLNESRFPLLSVNPIRVKAGEASGVLHEVQRDIGRALPFEFFPLSRLQPALRPGKALFEALFSLSIDEGLESSIWKTLKSTQPEADYILAVEVVLDRKEGHVRVNCAFTEPLSITFANELLEDLEATAKALVEGTNSISRVGSSIGQLSPTLVPSQYSGLDSEGESSDDESVPVHEDLETKIRAVVARFLRIEEGNIPSTASLITFGLDSIKSVGLVRTLRQEGLKLTTAELMRYPTIRRIAARQNPIESKPIDREEKQAEVLLKEALTEINANFDPLSIKLHDEDNVEVYPTTELQSGMLSQTVGSGGRLYVHAFPFTLSAEVDLDRLKVALQKAVQANSILRSSFHFISNLGRWVQAVHSHSELVLNDVELHDPSSLLSQVEGWISTMDFSSEDSFARPPVRARLYHTSKGSRTLVLMLHHALYDGISMARLSNIMESYYRDEEPSPASQFIDLLGYFLYQEAYGPQYWLNVLSNFRRTNLLQSDLPQYSLNDPAVQSDVTIPITAERFGEACMKFDATTQCFGQAALAKVLVRLYEKSDVVFGRVVSGRNTVQAENVIGPIITTLPCRVTFSHHMTNMNLVRLIHRGNSTSLKWQHSSLRALQRKLSLPSLWDAIIIFQPAIEDGEGDGPWHFADTEDEIAKIQYPLNIEIYQQTDSVNVRAACQANFMNKSGLKSLLEDFAHDLLNIINDPQAIAMKNLPISDDGDLTIGSDIFRKNFDGNERLANEQSDNDFHPNAHYEQLREIISASTKVPSSIIRPSSSLVSLGIDSISAIQISSKARLAGMSLHAADILRCDTLSDLNSVLSNAGQGISMNEDEPFARSLSPTLNATLLQRVGTSAEFVDDVYPASAGIKWLVGMWQMSGRSRFQHAFAFRLPKDVDKDRLRGAWSRVANESSILRSTFASANASNLHIITFKQFPPDRLWCERQSNSGSPGPKAVEEVMKELVSSPLTTVIPPAQGVFLHHDHTPYFILHLHHCQYDAWSLKLIVNDIERIYAGKEAIGSNNYEVFIQHYLAKSAREQQKNYWTTFFPLPFIPSLLPKIEINHRQGRGILTQTSALENASLLRRRAQQLSLSLNSVFLACWARAQAAYSHAECATFGLWHLGRTGEAASLENLKYPCMNVLPIHIDTSEASTSELCNHVQKILRRRTAVVEQSYLEDVSEWLGHSGILCNVFVNIVATYEDEADLDPGKGKVLEPVNVPYYIPNIASAEVHSSAEKLAVCDLVDDALLVDIVASDSDITISLEYAEVFLHADGAHELIQVWANMVRDVLHI